MRRGYGIDVEVKVYKEGWRYVINLLLIIILNYIIKLVRLLIVDIF